MATEKTPAPMSAAAFLASRSAAAAAPGAFPKRIDASGDVHALKRDLTAAVKYVAGLDSFRGIDNPAKRDAAIYSEVATRVNALGFRPASGPVSHAGPYAGKPYYTGLTLRALVRDLDGV